MIGVLEFDPDLPITAWRDAIAAAIDEHAVVIVAGETGSGKTTQLPKICLQLGRRSIAHTQPRRIAARSVAERVAEEMQVPLGELVGYQVRFTRKASRQTRLKIMTDGVLLAEIGRDRELRRYDTIIIDEAHERSLNIDFLLGYLRQLIDRRPDLKILITSATIDTERFAAHFADASGKHAPIVEIAGRSYPVEIRYRPLLADGEVDQVAGIAAAVRELSSLGNGDMLIFLSGEREIRDAAQAIEGLQLRFTEVLPLYARLSAAEQHRVFSGHTGRRIVLATNVAETSLTVPGIRYVIDTGLARISRYSARTKVQRLPIEPISQASANQRAGRCGRVAPGVCIRLYDEEDFAGRPAYTEPEILRTNLASVLLQMAAAELGPIEAFPFVEAPDRSAIADGRRLLEELDALTQTSGKRAADPEQPGRPPSPRLTAIGRRLAQLPVDPRLGRMLLAGETYGCLREVLVITSALSIQDPRERPAEHREKADVLHRRFWAPLEDPLEKTSAENDQPPEGDFLVLLRLWDYLQNAQRELSGNAFRRLCRDEFLHFLRIREWQDLHTQLRQITRELGLAHNGSAAPLTEVHRAVLSGLLSHVGLAEVAERVTPGGSRGRRGRATRDYLGARGVRFAINPGSSVAKVSPPLVMAAELVETSRLWARTVAGISADQIEQVGGHLVKRNYSEPHWSARSGAVMAYETVTLFGVPIVSGRRVGYGKINPAEAREIFLRSALVEGLWRTRHPFFSQNQATRAEAEELQERTRRRDLVVDDQVLFDFYDARIPADVTSGGHFDSWWKKTRVEQPDLLTLTMDDLLVPERAGPDLDAFPDVWRAGPHNLPLSYRFEPGAFRDGVSVTVPLAALTQLDPAPFSWQVPGLRTELATELIRSLPKAVRRNFVPAPEFAVRALTWLRDQPGPETESLPQALARALRGLTGELVDDSAWQLSAVPAHLQMIFLVVAEPGSSAVTAEGRDLAALQQQLAPAVSATLSTAAAEHTRTGATDWVFGAIADQVELRRGGHVVIGYPALVDEQVSVGLTVADTSDRQQRLHASGLRRLVLLGTPDPTRWVVSHLSNPEKLALGTSPYAAVPALLADARLAAVGELIRRAAPGRVADEPAFRRLCDAVRVDAADLMRTITSLAAEICELHGAAGGLLGEVARREPAAAEDLTEQLGNLVFRGFLSAAGYERLVDLPRYLQGARVRIDTLLTAPARDRAGFEVISRCEDAYAALCDQLPPGPLPESIAAIGWQLEELRISLFAQTLRTKVPVSEKRVMTAIAAARKVS